MSEQVETPTGGHPLAEFTSRLRTRLDRLTATSARPVWAMDASEQRQVLTDLATAAAQLEALRLQVLAEADRSGATGAEASASAAEWVAHHTRQRRVHARSDLRLAQALEHHTHTATAMAGGAINADQARVRSSGRSTGSRRAASSRSTRSSGPPPSSTSSASPGTTTPRSWRCWAHGSSRSSHPTWPRPSRGGCSRPRKQPQPGSPA